MSTHSSADRPVVMMVCDYSLTYLGGAQIAFLRQAGALLDQGWTVVVVAPGADEAFADRAAGDLVAVPVPVRFTIPGLDFPVLRPQPELARLLDGLVAAHGVTAIIAHSEFALASAALTAGHAAGIPVLHTVHTFFWRAPAVLSPLAPLVTAFHSRVTRLPRGERLRVSTPIDNALRGMTLRVAREADVVLSPSAHQAAALRAAGLAHTRTLSNVALPVVAAPGERREGAPLTLVWAGRFAPEKRIDVALDAVRLIQEERGPDSILLHVAGGEHGPLPGVVFHGRIPSERVGELMSEADAVLITSLGFDNQPMVALEAFAHSRPVVVTDPALRDEFGAAAVGTPAPDARGLADALLRLADDRGLVRSATAGAVEYATTRGPAEHAAALRAAIRSAPSGLAR